MPRAIRPTPYSPEDLHERNIRFAGEYPEMVTWFTQRYDPRREALIDFIARQKHTHERFLASRGWSQEAIDSLWAGIINNLAVKRQKPQAFVPKRRAKIIRQGNKWVIVES